MNKRGVEFAFNWLFSILIGAVIIFLAIYASTSFIKQERKTLDTEIVQQLETLLNPLQTTVESISKPKILSFPDETRLDVSCSQASLFGKSKISLSSRSNFGSAWESVSLPNDFSSYVFSEKLIQGKDFPVLVAPFSMPYKVADLVMIWSGKYCFVNSPSEVVDELGGIVANSSISLVSAKTECPIDSKSVCFLNSATDIDEGCNLRVNTYLKQVRGSGKLVYYEGPLMYAAIFSSAENYECQVKRIISRTKYLSSIYSEKSAILSTHDDCSSALQMQLQTFSSTLNISSSRDLSAVKLSSDMLQDSQEELICSLWK